MHHQWHWDRERKKAKKSGRSVLRYLVTAIGMPTNFKTTMARPRLQSLGQDAPPPPSPPVRLFCSSLPPGVVFPLFLSPFSLPRRSSDSGSLSRLFSPLQTTAIHAFIFIAQKFPAISFLVNAYRIASTHAAPSSSVTFALFSHPTNHTDEVSNMFRLWGWSAHFLSDFPKRALKPRLGWSLSRG